MKPYPAALALSSLALAGESAELPVLMEESPAGAFYHLVEALPLNEPHTLVLIDAHSDASGIADSDAVREAGAVADFVIVMPHWGTEHRLEPDERQLRFAQSLFEAGADLIVGSGPHVVQRLQHTRSGSVTFSLGNTVFDGPGLYAEWANGALPEVTLETDAERPQLVRARLIHTICDREGRVSVR